MEDAEHQDLPRTHATQVLLKMLFLNELKEAVCDCFCYLLGQSHAAACIMCSQLIFRFTCVLCSSAYGFSLIVQWYLGLLWVSYRCGVGATVLYGAFELASLSPLVHACRQ